MSDGKIEPIIWLLFFGIVVFAVCLFASEIWFKDDSQLFQVFAQLLSGFAGAILMRVTGKAKPEPPEPNTPVVPPAV